MKEMMNGEAAEGGRKDGREGKRMEDMRE